MFGYGLGLFLTYLGLWVMNGHGQPALLYLVPCTLGISFIISRTKHSKADQIAEFSYMLLRRFCRNHGHTWVGERRTQRLVELRDFTAFTCSCKSNSTCVICSNKHHSTKSLETDDEEEANIKKCKKSTHFVFACTCSS